MWRYPFGSGGRRVTPSVTLPARTSAATISRMKSLRSGVAGLSALTPLLIINSKTLVQYLAMSGRFARALEPSYRLARACYARVRERPRRRSGGSVLRGAALHPGIGVPGYGLERRN